MTRKTRNARVPKVAPSTARFSPKKPQRGKLSCCVSPDAKRQGAVTGRGTGWPEGHRSLGGRGSKGGRGNDSRLFTPGSRKMIGSVNARKKKDAYSRNCTEGPSSRRRQSEAYEPLADALWSMILS